MALSIKDPETEQLARELAKHTGETITQATKRALADRLRRARKVSDVQRDILLRDLEAIRERMNALPVLDNRSPDEIVGYDENGLPR